MLDTSYPQTFDDDSIGSAIESVLLVASGPVSIRALARLLETDLRKIERALGRLSQSLNTRGIRISIHEGSAELVTAPENASVVRQFLRLPQQPKLSRPALETLAIVAYKQPVTRSEIEEIRGVSAERVVATLLGRGLIEERGRRDSPGRPIRYGTTAAFLQLFGMTSLEELEQPQVTELMQVRGEPLGLTDPQASASLE